MRVCDHWNGRDGYLDCVARLMSVEEIVARLEADLFTVTQDDIRALITSWRERGEALKKMRGDIEWFKGLSLLGIKPPSKERP